MQNQKIRYLLMVSAGGLIGLMSFVRLAHATITAPTDSGSVCCSSVLFIPGIEGTRLYTDMAQKADGSTTTHRYWEPLSGNDAIRLHFISSVPYGEIVSLEQYIYSGKPIAKAYGLVDIYGKFMKFMDSLEDDKIINEWKAFGYDWRYPIDKVATQKEQKATSTELLVDTVLEMAGRSRTGKVTIVAHSNGGLVAKYLTKNLAEMGKSDLIDSMISVAVPFVGTPEGIAGLLHGDNQSIGQGLILNTFRARSLASRLPSVFGLLPSKEYFSKVFSPTIAFASTTVKNVNNGTIPKEIKTYKDQFDFIVDSKNIRINSDGMNTSIPTRGLNVLMKAAEIVHGAIDYFYWPQSIARWAIAGWNKTTTKGIVYDEKAVCNAISCSTYTVHSASTTLMGDGTVVAPSALYNAGKPISVDLEELSKQEKRDIKHANILGASSTLAVVKSIITNSQNPADQNQKVVDEISNIPGITVGEPDYSKEPSFIILSTHSPVELHAYDSEGNHTGLIPKPAEFAEVEDGLFTFYDQEIPGSEFTKVGGSEEDPEYQIYLPDNNGQKYSVVLNGTGLGNFTFDVQRIHNGSYIEKVEFAQMPVTPLTIAKTTVAAGKDKNLSTIPLASTTQFLDIDIDGNGTVDLSATTKTKVSEKDYLEMLKKVVINLLGDSPKSKNILGRIDKIEALIVSGKLTSAKEASNKLNSWIAHINRRTLSETEKNQIVEMINLYLSQYE